MKTEKFKCCDVILNTKRNREGRVHGCSGNVLSWYYPETPNNIHIAILPDERFVLLESFNLADQLAV